MSKSTFGKQVINREKYDRKYREENTAGRIKTNETADPAAAKRRRALEAYIEAKKLREMDDIDLSWQDLWR